MRLLTPSLTHRWRPHTWQETRGLTRSDDISRLLPAEAALLARGRSVRQSKLLFYAKMAEKGLQTYERDGWGEYSTSINPDRREIRPTADMGPILLCVDTSGSMRGAQPAAAAAGDAGGGAAAAAAAAVGAAVCVLLASWMRLWACVVASRTIRLANPGQEWSSAGGQLGSSAHGAPARLACSAAAPEHGAMTHTAHLPASSCRPS